MKTAGYPNYTGNPRALFEQQNQKLCHEFLKDRIVRREPPSLELIRKIHRILTGGTYDERRYVENGEWGKALQLCGDRETGRKSPDDFTVARQDFWQNVSTNLAKTFLLFRSNSMHRSTQRIFRYVLRFKL